VQFFVGHIMRKSKGQASPQAAETAVRSALAELG
jgi:Asp-tRNA(Asn)/Glu-tRNA(Gln) amidotransferase B subunit